MADWGKISDVTEMSRLSKTGEVQKFFRVSAVSTGGINFTLDVPEKEMKLEKVDQLCRERAQYLDSIKEM
jgi:hypothetical protein